MAVIEMLVLAVAAITAGGALVLIVVIIGIHQEERRGTVARENPPSGLARLTRRMLGAHFCLGADGAWANSVASEAASSQVFALTDFAPNQFEPTDQSGEAAVPAGYR
jgi:hypothetical protein